MASYNEKIRAFTSAEVLAADRLVRLNGAANTVVYADAGEQAIGTVEKAIDTSGDIVSVRLINVGGSRRMVAAGAFTVGDLVYAADDGKVDDVVRGRPIGYALESPTADGDVVEVMPLMKLPAEKGFINIPIGSFQEQDGTALADFSDGASAVPGYSAGDEGWGIRWNNHANPDPITANFVIPPDFDENVACTLHFLAAKTGATLADAVTWTVEAFNNVDGALYDADADYGGASSAMTGDATAKTVQEETLTLAAANLAAAPGTVTITVQPTDGTLGTDDVILFAVWVEYTKKHVE